MKFSKRKEKKRPSREDKPFRSDLCVLLSRGRPHLTDDTMLHSAMPVQLRRPALSSSSRIRSSSLTTRALFGFGKESEAAREKRLEKEEQFRLQQEVLQSRRAGAWKKVRKSKREKEKSMC